MIEMAVVGLGHISTRIIQGIQEANGAHLCAVVSSNKEKGKQACKQYKVSHYETLDELLKDDNVELVYIATPNKNHFESIMKCLHAKKHVMCEKPMVENLDQLDQVFQLANKQQCFLMEAHKSLFTPLNQKIKKLISEGVLGEVKQIQAAYHEDDYATRNKNHWVYSSDFGGSMFDLGVYPVAYANFMAHSFVKNIAVESIKSKQGYDIHNAGHLYYQNGLSASIEAGWQGTYNHNACLVGSLGRIETTNFWKATKATLYVEKETKIIEVEPCSDFKGEIEHAIKCIENHALESPIMGYMQSKEILKVVLETIGGEAHEDSSF